MTQLIYLSVLGLFLLPPLTSADDQPTVQTETTEVHQKEKRSQGDTMSQGDKTSQDKVTADSQKSNKSDLEITRQIRQKIVKNDSLSTDAHNVKIITQGGAVVLKGPVLSMTEKKQIERDARSIRGVRSVQNQLEIESDQG